MASFSSCSPTSLVAESVSLSKVDSPLRAEASEIRGWETLWKAATNVTLAGSGTAGDANAAQGQQQEEGGHDSFRYEWGTWVEGSRIEHLMEVANRIRLVSGTYEVYCTAASELSQSTPITDDVAPSRRSLRIAPPSSEGDGKGVEIWLHLLPPGSEHRSQYPSGSWTIVKCLTGFCEIAALTGIDRRTGQHKSRVVKQLRGGTDGSLGSGQSLGGDDCVKYVGGPLRSYRGKYGKTSLLEVVLRPPIMMPNLATPTADDDDNSHVVPPLSRGELDRILTLYQEPEVAEEVAESETELKAESGSPKKGMMGLEFERVGGLDDQLSAIARRVLASRANPQAARRLGIGHVRGILLSGPPGCGKTLLARELSRLLNAREPQIVNGPEILDKYIGEAEKKVRALFLPAEQEYAAAGDDAALHIIILDEMDAIARKRGTMTADTTGVRDSVVNQLLAKMDGVQSAPNVLVIGLTNRPELLDPALLRPGRLEVQLRVELPDLSGRRDILRIHTRQMDAAGGMGPCANQFIENLNEGGLPARTEHYTGAELAGLVRSAASFALSRTMDSADSEEDSSGGIVMATDLEAALSEVRPALGKQDDILQLRFPLGIVRYSSVVDRILRDLDRFTAPAASSAPRVSSMLLVGSGAGGTGVSALAAHAAYQASVSGRVDYVRFITALDVIIGSEAGSGEEARAAALVDKFAEARELPHALLVLDDVDQLCAGTGPGRYSSVMLAALRALLRTPPMSASVARAGGSSTSRVDSGGAAGTGRSVRILATTSRSDAACNTLHELFEEVVGKFSSLRLFLCYDEHRSSLVYSPMLISVVPTIKDPQDLERLLLSSLDGQLRVGAANGATVHGISETQVFSREAAARMLDRRGGEVGCKEALRLVERAAAAVPLVVVASGGTTGGDAGFSAAPALEALDGILQDVRSDLQTSAGLCEVVLQ
jgi:ATP-dependent 26S proteasome regulatory subunit